MYVFLSQDPEILQAQSNVILTAIVHGMKKEEPRFVTVCDVSKSDTCILSALMLLGDWQEEDLVCKPINLWDCSGESF